MITRALKNSVKTSRVAVMSVKECRFPINFAVSPLSVARGLTMPRNSDLKRFFSSRNEVATDRVYNTDDFVRDFPYLYNEHKLVVDEAKKLEDYDRIFEKCIDAIHETACVVNIQKRRNFLAAHRETRMDFLRDNDMATYDSIISKSHDAVEETIDDDIIAAMELYGLNVEECLDIIQNTPNQEELIDHYTYAYVNMELEQTMSQKEKASTLSEKQILQSCKRMMAVLESYTYQSKEIEKDNLVRMTYLNDQMIEKGWLTFDDLPKDLDHLSSKAREAVTKVIKTVILEDDPQNYSN
jgi:hypothetical protein